MCTELYCPCPDNVNLVLWQNETRNNYWGRTIVKTSTDYTYIYRDLTNATKFDTLIDCYYDRK